jgi:hypothetical protein
LAPGTSAVSLAAIARTGHGAHFHSNRSTMRIAIDIPKHASEGFQVRVVDADWFTLRIFTYSTIESARRAARAWTVAYGNCPIEDKSGA